MAEAIRPNFSGRWNADLAASRLVGPMPKAIVASIDHAEPDLRVQMTITIDDSAVSEMTFDARTTSEPVTNTIRGAEWISTSRWIDGELLIESHVTHAGRQMHFCDYWSLSSDGRRLTMEHRDDDLAGQVTTLLRADSEH